MESTICWYRNLLVCWTSRYAIQNSEKIQNTIKISLNWENISENFPDSKEKIQKILNKKEIWPYPSKNDDEPEQASQWKDRVKQVEEAGYTLWRDSKRNQKWEMRDTKGMF